MKKIAVLTSGGDAPGMNAVIRAITLTALKNDVEVLGVIRGYNGLMKGDFVDLTADAVADIITKGGTMLYSARSPEFKTEEGMAKAIATCKENGIEGIAVIGGDGSFRGARDLSVRGIPTVGVTGTIDNDIGCCDYTVGYDTALNTIVSVVDRIRDTTQSHDRCFVIEAMGRGAGYLALNSGIACGATAILIPEVDFDVEKDVIDKIKFEQSRGRRHFIIMTSEAPEVKAKIGSVEELAKKINEETGVESRATVLGHLQRGGSPTLRDRVIGTRMGNYAAHLLIEGKGNRVVAIKDDNLFDLDIIDALNTKKQLDADLYRVAVETAV
jgi:6-phosphofructokinase 1